MRSKEKVTTRDEILRNFTREFLIEEKRRCEIDRYVAEFRILIHKRPHENHNYLNRLLLDYTTIFLSHERICANKMNQEDVKYQLKTQLASRKKDSPKQRYVKSKLSEKNPKNSEHQSYLVLKAKTEEFLRKLRTYDELEQIAYEIFIDNSSSNNIKANQYENVLKLRESDLPSDIAYKKHHRNVYVVNSPKPVEKKSEKQTIKKLSGQEAESKNPLENYEFIKKETQEFLENNKHFNGAEQKMLSEQYQNNIYIKNYVDTLTSSEKSKKNSQSPKKGIFSRIKNMMGFSPETKFYKNLENTSEDLVDNTNRFLQNETKYSNIEYEAYKLFYIKHGEFQNPLIEVIEKIAYEKQGPSNKSTPENGKNFKKHKHAKLNQQRSHEQEFEDFNLVRCSPTEYNEPDQKLGDVQFQFGSPNIVSSARSTPNKNVNEVNSRPPNEDFMILLDDTNNFLNKQKLYEDQQRYYYVIHMRKYHINPVKEKKEGLISKIKHLFFGRQEKSKEKMNNFKEITLEFLRNEQYYHDLQKQAFYIFSKNHGNYHGATTRDFDKRNRNRIANGAEISEDVDGTELSRRIVNRKSTENLVRPQKLYEEMNTPARKEGNKKNGKTATLKKQDKTKTPPSLHHRSKSEDLLMFRTKTKSLDSKSSPTGYKTFSDRLKSMVGIGNRSRKKSRDMLRSTDPLQYFLDHERFYYDGIPEKQGKFGRSVSSIEYSPKDGTIKTKTRRFLSTENVLYQDHNASLVGKPPTGRRRKEQRNRDSKEKRRSRTLSPAQKLVSKIRNLVQKNNPEKEKEDAALTRKETHDFISDHKRFNDLLGSSLDSKTRFSQEESDIVGNVSSVPENVFKKVEKRVTSKSTNQEDTTGKSPPEIYIRKYEDLDKGENIVDRTPTLLDNKGFPTTTHGSNKSAELKNRSNRSENIHINSVEIENVPFESRVEVIQHFPEARTENITRVTSVERGDNVSCEEGYSASEISTRVMHNTITKKTRITNRITTESVQRTTKEMSTREWNFPHDTNETSSQSQERSPKTEPIYQNVSFPETKSTCSNTKAPIIHYERHETLQEGAIPHIKTSSSRDIIDTSDQNMNMDSINSETSELLLQETISTNIRGKKSDEEQPDSKQKVTIKTQKELNPLKYNINITGTQLNIPEPKETEYKSGNSSIEIEEKPKKNTFSKFKSYVIGSAKITSRGESDELFENNTKQFLDDMRKHHDHQRDAMTKVVWLSEQKAGTNKQQKQKDEPKTPIAMTEKEKKNLELIKQNTNISLEDHQEETHFQRAPISKTIVTEKVTVSAADTQRSAPKKSKESPEKEVKGKKNTFSKLKSYVIGSHKQPNTEESNKLIRQNTTDFIDDMRKHHDEHNGAITTYKVLWLSEQKPGPIEKQKIEIQPKKPIAMTEKEKKNLQLIRKNTNIFLKDHQEYHNKQRIEDNEFFGKIGKPESFIWIASRPNKKKDNIITKVKNLMSPQQSKKSLNPSDEVKHKLIRDQTDEFLRKHQYLIHKEETDFQKAPISKPIVTETVTVLAADTQSSAPKKLKESPEKEVKGKKNTFSKLKSYVIGPHKQPTTEESNKLIRQNTTKFIDDMRKHHDEHNGAITTYKVLWLSEQKPRPIEKQKIEIQPKKPIAMTEKEKKNLQLIRKNTNIFLKDHQEYHNKQRIEDNEFFGKIGKPESFIWIASRPNKKKDNIITKVKNLMSPQQSKKSLNPSDEVEHKLMRDQTDEFLWKHQYLIHKEETDFQKAPISKPIVTETVTVLAADTQSSAPKKLKESPEKEVKGKKNTFSKLKSYVNGSHKQPTTEESNELIRQNTTKFIDDMRKHHDEHNGAITTYKILWLSEQKPGPIEKEKIEIQPKKPIAMTEKEKKNLQLIRKNTNIFLKDHQEYHNKQRIEDNEFFGKIGKPESFIWIASRPNKKRDNIITKVKNLMSPQQSKKSLNPSDEIKHKLIRDQTDEFLRKHQYLIHKEETDFQKAPISKPIVTETVTVLAADTQSSAPKKLKESPEKEVKGKKNTFSKLKSYVIGSHKQPTTEESNKLIRQNTTKFIDDMRKHHDEHNGAITTYKVLWLSEQKPGPIEKQKIEIQPKKPIAMTEKEKKNLQLIRKNTNIFLKDHQEYHNKQRIEDNEFFGKIGKPESFIWIASRPNKKKDNIITKVKNLMSPQQSKEFLNPSDEVKHKLIRDQTDEFLRKHQYLIHKEETDFQKAPVSKPIVTETVTVLAADTQSSAPKKLKESPEKEVKGKKNTFSKLKSYVIGSHKQPTTEESNKLFRQNTTKFIDDMRKHHDEHNGAITTYKVLWLSEQKPGPIEKQKIEIQPNKPIAMTEKEKKNLQLIRKNTNIFLKDHQEYHNKQRMEDNEFFGKIGKPESFIWNSSRPNKKKDNIITKVKNLMSPQQSKKSLNPSDEVKHKLIRDQTDEFLRKHQYLIHKEETDFQKAPISKTIVTETVTVLAADTQSSAPKKLKESPEKEVKGKKNTFSKLKSYVIGSHKQPTTEESNKLIRQNTTKFIDDMRKHHDEHNRAITTYKVLWLSEQKPGPIEKQKIEIQPKKPIAMTEKEKKNLQLIRKNTNIFLKDHQEYHNKQRIEDNEFFGKIGKPESFIWIASRPNKKKDNIITKVKNLMSPQQSKKSLNPSDEVKHKLIRDQTDEFLRKHQYLIHKEETDFQKAPISKPIVTETVTVLAADTQSSAPKKLKESPEKEVKGKKNTFSKLKSYVIGSHKQPTLEESNKLIRQNTTKFIDDMRKHHDEHNGAITTYKVLWLSEQKPGPIEKQKIEIQPKKPIAMTEKEKKNLQLIRKNTNIFLKDHQEYHNKQRIEDNEFFGKIGKPESFIWIASRPNKKKDNIITKVKNLMSPQQSKKSLNPSDEVKHKLIRDQTDEFLRKHQYLIHKEETDFQKAPVSKPIVTETVTVLAADTQSSAPKKLKESPEKEVKGKKNTFSKLKSYVIGSHKQPTTEESNKLIRQNTTKFIDDMRKHHDEHNGAITTYKVLWLSEQKPGSIEKQKIEIQPNKPIAMTEKEKKNLQLIRKNTNIFLKDHQEYHNKQRMEDNEFFGKIRKPESFIWISSRPNKKKDNIITKVKNLMSPQQSKKSLNPSVEVKHKLIRDQTDEFLRKHQYLIHKEETDFQKAPISKTIVTETVTVLAADTQSSAPKKLKESPEKEVKGKKNTFSKLKSYVIGSHKQPTTEESNKLIRQNTTKFIDDMRKHHDEHNGAITTYKVLWLSEQKPGPIEKEKIEIQPKKPIAMTEKEKKNLQLIRKNTNIFLKDHQEYHNKQRIEDNEFFGKIGKPESFIWIASRPNMKKDNIITKVKNLMSPQQSKKFLNPSDEVKHKLIRDQTDEFLRKHQYLIHKEETDFQKAPISKTIVTETVTVLAADTQSSAPKKLKESPEKEVKGKKNTFSKLKSYVIGSHKQPTTEESNKLIRQNTTKFIDDMRKHHDEHNGAITTYKVLWLSEQKPGPIEKEKIEIQPKKPIAMTEKEKKNLQLIRKNTNIFLKDHQEYHDKQRIEDNEFFGKIGKPESFIWIASRPNKKKDNIITKVKNLMSPQQSKKSLNPSDEIKHKLIRDQTDEFLRKHQYLIHKEETDFQKAPISKPIVTETVTVLAADTQSSAPKKLKESPEKEVKGKKNTFSKLKSYVIGSHKQPTTEESNKLIRQNTTKFIDDMRKHHDEHNGAITTYKVLWLSEQKPGPIEKQKIEIQPKKPIAMTEKEKKNLQLIRKNTNIFLKDHQEYHNKQRIEDYEFFGKIGKPESFIWIASRPNKKKDNIITKVKNLMSPQQSKKSLNPSDEVKHKLIRDQTDEFLRKHQYLIHKEETDFQKAPISKPIVREKVTVSAADTQSSAPKKSKESPEKEVKGKKNTFSKLKSYVIGSHKQPTTEESNKLIRQNTTKFIDDMRKHHDEHNGAITTYKVLWLSEQKPGPINKQKIEIQPKKPIAMTKEEKKNLQMIRQNTNIFLKDHQEYHNKQRIEDNEFFGKIGKPESFIWIASRPNKKKDNITKVKNRMSPQQSMKSLNASDDVKHKLIRDQTDEFLRKHQYLIHKEETDFQKAPISKPIVTEKVTVSAADTQSSAPKKSKESPEKEVKGKKNTFSKLKSYVIVSHKQPNTEESNKLIRQNTTEFIDDMRKHHDEHNGAITTYKVLWLSEQKPGPTKQQKIGIQPKKPIDVEGTDFQKAPISKSKVSEKVCILAADQKDCVPKTVEKARVKGVESKNNSFTKLKSTESTKIPKPHTVPDQLVTSTEDIRLIRQNTDIFLKDHQDYHNRNRGEDNGSFGEIGVAVVPILTPENKVAPAPRKNIISKVKNILSPGKTENTAIFYYDVDNKIDNETRNLNDDSSEFTSNDKYPIHQHKIDAPKPQLSTLNNSVELGSSKYSDLPLQQIPKKKVTFSETHSTDSGDNSIINEQDTEYPFDDTSHVSHQASKKVTSSRIPLKTNKPQVSPRKQDTTKVKAIFIDSAEIFKQDKELYLIQETSEFIEDHRKHQINQWIHHENDDRNKEKSSKHIEEELSRTCTPEASPVMIEQITTSVSSSQQDTSVKKPEDPLSKEPKLKTKLMSKIKSLVGNPQENISPDKRREIDNARRRKQTLEFLISQKCYNDLEGDACYKFCLKQSEKEKFATRSKPQRIELVDTSSENNIKSDPNSAFEGDSTFCTPRKLPVNGSPRNYSTKSQEPQRSSPDKKISKTAEITMKEKSDSKINENTVLIHDGKSPEISQSIGHTQNFIEDQKYYINSENTIWKQYLKYKPAAGSTKKHVQQEKYVQKYVGVQNTIPTPKDPKRKSSSQIESRRIDYEVILHQTKMFLDDHKGYHDTLHEVSSKYIPKQTGKTAVEGKIEERKEGVLTKIKSFLPSGQTKNRSYDIRKAEILHSEDGTNSATPKSVYIETHELLEKSPAQSESEIELKTLTMLFLKDHQDYHDLEASHIPKYKWKGDEREKKAKKGVISKLKSLVTGDKKTSSKKLTNASPLVHSEEVDRKIPNEHPDEISIRELDSSPTTYRRIKRPQPSMEQKQETVSKIQNIDLGNSSTAGDTKSMSHETLSSKQEMKNFPTKEVIEPQYLEDISGAGYETENKLLLKKCSYDQLKMLPNDERKKYANDKIKTQDFLLNQKQFSDAVNTAIVQGSKDLGEVKSIKNYESGERHPSNELNNITDRLLLTSKQKSPSEMGSTNFVEQNKSQVVEIRDQKYVPSAPSLEECQDLTQREKDIIQSVVHRTVKPVSPTKTIFKEIRKREDSPDRQVYILKEGYMITKENEDGDTKDNAQNKKGRRMGNSSVSGKSAPVVGTSEKHSITSTGEERKRKEGEETIKHFLSLKDGSASADTKKSTEGQDYVDRSDDLPARVVPQGDLEVRRHTTKNCFFIFLVVLVVLIAIYIFRDEEDDNNE